LSFLWSKPAAKSLWVRSEADFGHRSGKLIQASTDAELSPRPFDQIQCARLQDWNGEADHPDWIKVPDSVRAVTASNDDKYSVGAFGLNVTDETVVANTFQPPLGTNATFVVGTLRQPRLYRVWAGARF
jgi:hypothetical protein